VKIFERKDRMLAREGGPPWTGSGPTVGSTNLDWRSLLYNGRIETPSSWVPEFATQLNAVFREGSRRVRGGHAGKNGMHGPSRKRLKEGHGAGPGRASSRATSPCCNKIFQAGLRSERVCSDAPNLRTDAP